MSSRAAWRMKFESASVIGSGTESAICGSVKPSAFSDFMK